MRRLHAASRCCPAKAQSMPRPAAAPGFADQGARASGCARRRRWALPQSREAAKAGRDSASAVRQRRGDPVGRAAAPSCSAADVDAVPHGARAWRVPTRGTTEALEQDLAATGAGVRRPRRARPSRSRICRPRRPGPWRTPVVHRAAAAGWRQSRSRSRSRARPSRHRVCSAAEIGEPDPRAHCRAASSSRSARSGGGEEPADGHPHRAADRSPRR